MLIVEFLHKKPISKLNQRPCRQQEWTKRRRRPCHRTRACGPTGSALAQGHLVLRCAQRRSLPIVPEPSPLLWLANFLLSNEYRIVFYSVFIVLSLFRNYKKTYKRKINQPTPRSAVFRSLQHQVGCCKYVRVSYHYIYNFQCTEGVIIHCVKR